MSKKNKKFKFSPSEDQLSLMFEVKNKLNLNLDQVFDLALNLFLLNAFKKENDE